MEVKTWKRTRNYGKKTVSKKIGNHEFRNEE